MQWLHEDVRLLAPTRETLDLLLEQVENLRSDVLSVTRKTRLLSRTEPYAGRNCCCPFPESD